MQRYKQLFENTKINFLIDSFYKSINDDKWTDRYLKTAQVIDEGTIKFKKVQGCKPNYCELNAFTYAKENNIHLVIGFGILNTVRIYHWWVWDGKYHIEITPLKRKFDGRIGQVIKKSITDNTDNVDNLYTSWGSYEKI